MLRLFSIVCLSFACCAMPAERDQDSPSAAAPTAVRVAQKVFLANSGVDDLAYNTFFSAIATWGRYQIVASPGEADLVVELAYRVGHGRTWVRDEDYDRRDQVVATTTLTIFDARSNTWQ